MPDLIFHIGLPGCGSSTLQRDVFQHEDGYLGTAPRLDAELNFAKKLQLCTPFGGRLTLDKEGLRTWALELKQLKRNEWPETDRLILSNEVLSAANRLSDAPILRVLSELQERAWVERIRVLLVLRSQSARIASGYAQVSAKNPNASQLDFERHVARTMRKRRNRRLFDYSKYVEGLSQVVGRENLCVLLIEETGSLDFWLKLADFCQLTRFDPATMIEVGAERKNKKSLSPHQWAISSFDPKKTAKDRVDRWMNLLWPKRQFSSVRNRVQSYAADRIALNLSRSRTLEVETRREKRIYLTPIAKTIIEEHCGPFNASLSRQLGKDLAPLGYPVLDGV